MTQLSFDTWAWGEDLLKSADWFWAWIVEWTLASMQEQACFAVILFPYYFYYLTGWSWSAATLLYILLDRICQTKPGKIQSAIEVGPYIGGRHWISRSRVYSDRDLSSPLHSSYPQKARLPGICAHHAWSGDLQRSIVSDQGNYLQHSSAKLLHYSEQSLSSWILCNL